MLFALIVMTTPIFHGVALLGHLLLVINNFICSRCTIRKGIAHPFSLLIVVQQGAIERPGDSTRSKMTI